MSSRELSRVLGVQYRTGSHLCHRIRHVFLDDVTVGVHAGEGNLKVDENQFKRILLRLLSDEHVNRADIP